MISPTCDRPKVMLCAIHIMQLLWSLLGQHTCLHSNGAGVLQWCLTPGFMVTAGYDGRSATLCPAGTYSIGGNHDACTPCNYGYTSAAGAESDAGCKIAPGFGWYSGKVELCPKGKITLNVTCYLVTILGHVFDADID